MANPEIHADGGDVGAAEEGSVLVANQQACLAHAGVSYQHHLDDDPQPGPSGVHANLRTPQHPSAKPNPAPNA